MYLAHVHVQCSMYMCTITIIPDPFFFPARTCAGPKIVLVPRDLCLYICLSALEDHHAVYTRCIGRMHSLATTSGPARKVGVVSIFKMADLEQTLLNLSSSKIR